MKSKTWIPRFVIEIFFLGTPERFYILKKLLFVKQTFERLSKYKRQSFYMLRLFMCISHRNHGLIEYQKVSCCYRTSKMKFSIVIANMKIIMTKRLSQNYMKV